MYGCSILTLAEYKESNDKIGHYIHWKICKYFEIHKSEKGYKNPTKNNNRS